MRKRSSSPLGAAAVTGLAASLLCGCLPAASTPILPLHGVTLPVGSTAPPHSRSIVMVATLVPRGRVVSRGLDGVLVGAARDDHGRGLARALTKLRPVRKVVGAPLVRAGHGELLAAARKAQATRLVTSQVVSVRVRRGPNARFAGLLVCALTVGMTLVALPACMAIPAHTLEAEVELELAIWDVRQRRRVWQRRVRRTGWLAVSSYTAGRAVQRVIARGANVAYRAALPGLCQGLAATAGTAPQKSGVKR